MLGLSNAPSLNPNSLSYEVLLNQPIYPTIPYHGCMKSGWWPWPSWSEQWSIPLGECVFLFSWEVNRQICTINCSVSSRGRSIEILLTLNNRKEPVLGGSHIFSENLWGFQSGSQNENRIFSHKVIIFLRISTPVLSQVRISFLKTLKGISFHLFWQPLRVLKRMSSGFQGV
jgi:hypothetical protein